MCFNPFCASNLWSTHIYSLSRCWLLIQAHLLNECSVCKWAPCLCVSLRNCGLWHAGPTTNTVGASASKQRGRRSEMTPHRAVFYFRNCRLRNSSKFCIFFCITVFLFECFAAVKSETSKAANHAWLLSWLKSQQHFTTGVKRSCHPPQGVCPCVCMLLCLHVCYDNWRATLM